MRRFTVVASALALCLSSCTHVTQEFRHSGGLAGKKLDGLMLDASQSKQLQLLRAAIIIAMASRVGNASVRDGREADAFVEYLNNATEELNFAAGHVYPVDGHEPCVGFSTVKGAPCGSHVVLFESDLPQLEYKVGRLVLASLPQKRAAAFAQSIGSGNIMSAALKALQLAINSLDGLHRGAATYRSVLEIEAQLLAEAGQCKDGSQVNGITTVDRAVSCLGLSSTSLTRADAVNLPVTVPASAFDALFAVARTSCGMLPINVAVDQSGSDDANAPKPIEARQAACRKLRFKPALRFGGMEGILAKASKPAQGAAPAIMTTDPTPAEKK